MPANFRFRERNHIGARGLAVAGLLAVVTVGCGRADSPPQSPTAAEADIKAPHGASATTAAVEPAAAPSGATSPSATEISMVDLRRQLYAFEQRFRAEDAVCAALARENMDLSRTITSNETVILSRLQADTEWNRIRNELVEAQRAGDQMRMHRAIQRRGEAMTNALRSTFIEMRTGAPDAKPAATQRKEQL